MKILLCGGRGFIGSAIARALRRDGHAVVAAVSPGHPAGPHTLPVDYARDTQPQAWRPRLDGIDAVVNAVGVLRDSRARPIDAVHQHTPIALWEACAEAGVAQVVQVSALGIEGSDTRYARTKRAADARLLALAQQGRLTATVLRPSVVFGRGGDSSALFMTLARLPVLLLPGPVLRARVQPVAVHDVADLVAALLRTGLPPRPPLIECTGPEPLTMAAFIADLRRQCGHGAAKVLRLPDALSRLSARAGDLVPGVPWCSETLAMLGTDNVGDPALFTQWLGRTPTHYRELVERAWKNR